MADENSPSEETRFFSSRRPVAKFSKAELQCSGIGYKMNRKQELNAFIKECITKALIELMENKPLEDITVTELVKKAGVGRVSFYRNFESKEDVLRKQLDSLLEEWGEDYNSRNDPAYFLESLLNHYYTNKDFFLLLYRRGLSTLMYESIRQVMKIDESENNIERYAKSTIAGLIFGAVDEWMRLGMKETPQEIIFLTSQLQNQRENIR
ncbi:MAG: TetR/AcrR family transcriptional regulator [Lachnospiraceae bacterium]|nr:TetR/AcrR family transcriptional regulator [Lachnospiraceae bacterium]